ncbi:hypothetical protein PIB30_029172 [Stylosanthes scabra]|uniref:LNS2/PITP domain-containing protein n=1 Tax=Stylosanthes scabra TaxID=79078 RepID=A0ABU6ZC77_9FABA|nr:hypothetical protein [Stylosanthes scabra]
MRRIGSYITQGVYTVSGPFHPFGGAVDIVVVQQPDGTFKSSPWYVRFGKFQGVLKAREKIVDINVNGVDADFHMHLDHKGEAYFLREVDAEDGESIIYPSSGDEIDDNRSRLLNDMQVQQRLRSKSCNYDSEKYNGNAEERSRGSLFGFVFGRKSIDEGVEMAPAEIAADLLELNWSTNVKNDRRPPRFVDKRKIVKSSSEGDLHQDALPPLEIKEEEEAGSISNSNSEHGQEKTVIKIDVAHEVECDPNGKEGGGDHECSDFPVELVEVEVGGGLERKLSEGDLATGSGFATPSDIVSLDENISADEVAQSAVLCETLGKALADSADKSNVTSHDVSSAFSPPKESLGVQETTISPLAGSEEEENFRFSDLDERKTNDQLDKPVSPESVDKEEEEEHHSCDDGGDVEVDNFVTDNGDLHLSSPLAIPRTEVAGEDIGRTGSLPNIASRRVDLGQPGAYYPFSQSLDTRSKSLPWLFPENDDSKGLKSYEANENQLSNGKPDAKDSSGDGSPPSGWRLWPFSRSASQTYVPPIPSDFKDTTCEQSSEDRISTDPKNNELKTGPKKKQVREKAPTSEEIASLHLKEGGNTVMFTFSTSMLGKQQVDCRIYLWKWNTRVVISDVDGTITKSDVLGQFMPLVGIDWSQTGVAHLFSAIKENGYQLLFLSARSISQAYLTRQFLFNLKQDGKALPDGPVVISPDGLFPSLYREVIRRVPHEFKIACLEDIKSLFPSDCNPFYAGFGNRDTDEISYLKVGIPLGKIFIINPKGEIVVNRRIDTKSYTSLHALVNGMFPPMTSTSEQEDFNSWNFWKLPPPSLDF